MASDNATVNQIADSVAREGIIFLPNLEDVMFAATRVERLLRGVTRDNLLDPHYVADVIVAAGPLAPIVSAFMRDLEAASRYHDAYYSCAPPTEDDYERKCADAQDRVSFIPDASVRRAAFESLMKGVIHPVELQDCRKTLRSPCDTQKYVYSLGMDADTIYRFSEFPGRVRRPIPHAYERAKVMFAVLKGEDVFDAAYKTASAPVGALEGFTDQPPIELACLTNWTLPTYWVAHSNGMCPAYSVNREPLVILIERYLEIKKNV
jgi:hypothetical protein